MDTSARISNIPEAAPYRPTDVAPWARPSSTESARKWNARNTPDSASGADSRRNANPDVIISAPTWNRTGFAPTHAWGHDRQCRLDQLAAVMRWTVAPHK